MFRFIAQANKQEFRAEVGKIAGPFLYRVLELVREEMRRRFLLGKSGKPGRHARRSAPGEAPARQSGRLFNSMPIVRLSEFRSELTANALYASYLEDGTSRMRPRPFALVSVVSVTDQLRGKPLI